MTNLTGGETAFIIAILTHAAATIWWASKTNTTMSFIRDELIKIRDELKERDSQISGIWRKIDLIQNQLLKTRKE